MSIKELIHNIEESKSSSDSSYILKILYNDQKSEQIRECRLSSCEFKNYIDHIANIYRVFVVVWQHDSEKNWKMDDIAKCYVDHKGEIFVEGIEKKYLCISNANIRKVVIACCVNYASS